jgi:dipeptidyl aminopeptidase/acylaminoacyl peptidase
VEIQAGQETVIEGVLSPETPTSLTPGRDFGLSEAQDLHCNRPLDSRGTRRQIHFTNDGQPNQLSFYYTPLTTTTTSLWPILLAIYPGPADTWECVSLPLTAAGYAVIATGPAYSFDLEADLAELERILAFVREGKFPGADGNQIALLGGSYSSLHVQRLLQREQAVDAALLMGPPTDLFDMRRRLENGTFIPPFGLDQAFYALGLPSREPLRYLRYSGAYHIRPDFPPIAILHSTTDEIVPYQQSELLVQQLETAGVPYEVYFFEGGGHYLLAQDGDSDVLEMYEITLEFLEKHLK